MEVIYITPNGTEISELKLRERYGDEKFEMFLAEGKLKKKTLRNYLWKMVLWSHKKKLAQII